jgi:hypothetical protein
VKAWTTVCWLDPCTWHNDRSAIFKVSSTSFWPGSDQYIDLTTGMYLWEQVLGANFDFRFELSSNSDGRHIHGDTVSEVMFLSFSTESFVDIDNRAGGFAHVISVNGRIYEVDIAFNLDNLSNSFFGPPPEWMAVVDSFTYYLSLGGRDPIALDYQFSFRETAIHELGHSLGLDHTTKYGILLPEGSYTGSPHIGYYPYVPLTEDRKGLRRLYPDGNTEQDMMASFHFSSGRKISTISNYGPEFEGVCPGDELEFYKTTLNMGTSRLEMPLSYYLTDDLYLHLDDIYLESGDISVGAEDAYTNSRYLTIPRDVELNKFYYVAVYLDPNDDVGERYENNNRIIIGYILTGGPLECGTGISTTHQRVTIERPRRSYTGLLPLSTVISHLRFNNHEVRKAPDGYALYSYYNVDVLDTFRGTTRSNMKIRQIGGAVIDEKGDHIEMSLSHAPKFTDGEEFIVFLGQNNRMAIPFVNGDGGVLRVVTDPKYGKIVTTYEGTPFAGYDVEKNEFILMDQWDLAKEDTNKSGNQELDEEGKNASLTLKRASVVPMTLQAFKTALRVHIENAGQIPILEYEETEPTSIFKEHPPKFNKKEKNKIKKKVSDQ